MQTGNQKVSLIGIVNKEAYFSNEFYSGPYHSY